MHYGGDMNVLGIADNHDSGAAVVIDGELVSAVNQERVDRIKLSGAFPWGAIDAALETAGLKERDIDRIVVGSGFTPSTVLRALPKMHHQARDKGQFSRLLHAYIVYQSALRKTGLHTLEMDASQALLESRLRGERPFDRARVTMMDHHQAHAEVAYRTQADPHCLVLTVDAMGDGTTCTAWMGDNGRLERLYRQSGLASIGTFYSRITQLLGFRPVRHEGKITGLAAYAEPPPRLVRHFASRMRFVGPGFSRVSLRGGDHPGDPFWSEVQRWSKEEVASAAQAVLEEAVVAYVQHWVRQSGCGVVALAGGVFANVKLNQRLHELPEVDRIWVVPHMGDGGLAAGAALGSVAAAPQQLHDAYLGPGIEERDAYKALKRGEVRFAGLGRESTEGAGKDVLRAAEILAEGKVVARATGRMEWGPRALGNRSVLVRPHDPTVNVWLNEKLNRSEFMPFAPVVRAEDADRYFRGVDPARTAAEFMTACFDCTDLFAEHCPAAVHVDGTARPQLVREEVNPSLHACLTRVGELTGVPVLVNTSFNLHEEPIVCTASDAVRAFKQAKLDALWLGPFVAEQGSE